MNDDGLMERAAELESLLPRLMRRLFTLDPAQPANELPVGQLRLCTILQTGPRQMSQLAEELGISMSALTQITDRLQRSELVERVTEDEDRRSKLLHLTPRGMEMMRSRRECRVRQASSVLRQLTPERRAQAIAAIRELAEASSAPPAFSFAKPSEVRAATLAAWVPCDLTPDPSPSGGD
jgi:DNA-binding MarR family transcriptional regulator